MAAITILGTGAMGSRMALRLLQAGHIVTVWNRSPAAVNSLLSAGALAAETPAAAVKGADFVIAVVRDDTASRSVWLGPETGALAGLEEHTIALECSTLSMAWVKELNTAIVSAGRQFVDAPVVGSRPQAEAGQLIYLVGGEPEQVAAVTPLLQVMGTAVHHIGHTGAGTALKLAVNALFGVQVAALAELLAFLSRAGVERSQAIDALVATPVCSPAVKGAAASMLAGNFAPLFPISLASKDLDYVLTAAGQSRATLPVTSASRGVFAQALERDLGADNITAVARLYA
jgi:3-hydroxyisobutyrate dehydrogenase-like beta-hydroxyacid dehydrogenase